MQKEKITIVLLDNDNEDTVLGVLKVFDNTSAQDVEKIFQHVRSEEKPYDWCVEDLIAALTQKGIDYSYEEEKVYSIMV